LFFLVSPERPARKQHQQVICLRGTKRPVAKKYSAGFTTDRARTARA
jgi:hypothetical protein